MDEENILTAILIGVGIILLVLVLSLPVTGIVFGQQIILPIVGWIAFAAFAVIALFLYFKHRA